MKNENNVELVTRMMEFAPTGPLSQAFVIEAIARYAKQVADLTDEQVAKMDENSIVSMEVWRETAEYIQEQIQNR